MLRVKQQKMSLGYVRDVLLLQGGRASSLSCSLSAEKSSPLSLS